MFKHKITLLLLALWLAAFGSTWAQSNALHFDGTDDYVTCPAINPTSLTISAWVYPTIQGKDQAIISTLSESAMMGMELHIGADNIPVMTIRSGSNWVDVKGTTPVALSTWTHVAATCSGSMVYLYVNGKKDKGVTLTNGYSPSTRYMNLGRRMGIAALYFSGRIDEVSIWSKVLSEFSISSIYERGLTGSETGLLAYYKFDHGIAGGDNRGINTLTDATANANDSKLTNFDLRSIASNWVSGYTAPVSSTVAITPPALGEGTSANPYQIATLENLYWLSQNSSVWTSKHFKQTQDIDLAAISNWMPIGSAFVPFTGTYDGDGHTISNLNINSTLTYRGLFGFAADVSVLKNLTLENASVTTTGDYASMLVAFSRGTISNCHTRGGTLTAGRYVGGMCGYGIVTIEDCSNSASVVSSGGCAGGIAGELQYGIIRRCGNSGTISSSQGNAGGMVGFTGSGTTVSANCTISDCYNTAAISIQYYSGGIIGYSTGVNMYRCYSVGEVTGTYGGGASGGLVGWCNADYYHNISNSYCLQSPAIGYYSTTKYTTVTNVSTKTTAQLQTQSTFSGWDFVGETTNGTADYWAVTTGFNNGYPTLASVATTCTNGVVDLSKQPAGTAYNWYKVNGTKLTETIDYIVDGGKTKFIKLPGSKVYCTMTNAAFPQWLARTGAVTVDKVVVLEPNITFVSGQTGALSFSVGATQPGKLYVDWGNGTLVPFDISITTTKISTAAYANGSNVKVYCESIYSFIVLETQVSSLNLFRNPALKKLGCYGNKLQTLDISGCSALEVLSCNNNSISALDVSNNPALQTLYCFGNNLTSLSLGTSTLLQYVACENNSLSFATLPLFKKSFLYYRYAPQANLPATCTNGVVDLSSQLSAVGNDGNTQTTVYAWFNANGSPLAKGIDYMEEAGVFTFVSQPAGKVYCSMTNVAFPLLTLRTDDLVVDTVLSPNASFVSRADGALSFELKLKGGGPLVVDWGDGTPVRTEVANYATATIATSTYKAGGIVKVFAPNISSLNVSGKAVEKLNIGTAANLLNIFCPYNGLSFATLPPRTLQYDDYIYEPQGFIPASCKGGVVDLSQQLAATNIDGNTQTTTYQWFTRGGALLTAGVDYVENQGLFSFVKGADDSVYCSMTNAAFPNLLLRTTNVKIDKVMKPAITFMGEDNGEFTFNMRTRNACTVYIDWGDGRLTSYPFTTEQRSIYKKLYKEGDTAKIYADSIALLSISNKLLLHLGVGNCSTLEELNTYSNKIDTLDLSHKPELWKLSCGGARIRNLDLSHCPKLSELYCQTLHLKSLDLSNNPSLGILNCNDNKIEHLYLSKNPNLYRLDCGVNKLTKLDLSTNILITELRCNTNQLDTLDVSHLASLRTLVCYGNSLHFGTLPLPRATFAEYDATLQHYLPTTCTMGVVDLSSQHRVTDLAGQAHTTTYEWMSADYKTLTEGVDYTGAGGIFKFITKPDTTVFCVLQNPAFPGLKLFTTTMAIDTMAAPAVSFASENAGALRFTLCLTESATVLVDWGNGTLNTYRITTTEDTTLSFANYKAGATVRVIGENIAKFDCSGQGITALNLGDVSSMSTLNCSDNKLTKLGIATFMGEFLDCSKNLLDFKALPVNDGQFIEYTYCPQNTHFNITSTRGVVDLSSQLLVEGSDGTLFTTRYDLFRSDDVQMMNNFMEDGGVFKFVEKTGTVISCTMTNDALANLSIPATITIDTSYVLPKPNIALVSEISGNFSVGLQTIKASKVYVDWGDDTLMCYYPDDQYYEHQTKKYISGRTVKIFCDDISAFYVSNRMINSLDVSKCTHLTELICDYNKLDSLNLGANSSLELLVCGNNFLRKLDLRANNSLESVDAENNVLDMLLLPHTNTIHTISVNDNRLNFATLPAPRKNVSNYSYTGQDSLYVVAQNGVVDLSSQLTVVDTQGVARTTVYTWHKTGAEQLINGVDYVEKNGVFAFLQQPDTTVYCTMKNAAFPELTMHTIDFKVGVAKSDLCPAYRFTTLYHMAKELKCSSIPSAEKYEWEFTPVGSTTPVVLAGEGPDTLAYPGKAGLAFATTYSVRVRAMVSGAWLSYGEEYTFATPATKPTTRLGAHLHNWKMKSITDTIVCIKVTGATLYLYEFVDEASGQRFRHYNKGNSLRVSDVSGIQHGRSYKVTVLPRFFNSLSVFDRAARIYTPKGQPQ